MANIRSLVVSLSAQTDGFERGLSRAGTRLTTFERSVVSMGATQQAAQKGSRLFENALQDLAFKSAGLEGAMGKLGKSFLALGGASGPLLLLTATLGAAGLAFQHFAKEAKAAEEANKKFHAELAQGVQSRFAAAEPLEVARQTQARAEADFAKAETSFTSLRARNQRLRDVGLGGAADTMQESLNKAAAKLTQARSHLTEATERVTDALIQEVQAGTATSAARAELLALYQQEQSMIRRELMSRALLAAGSEAGRGFVPNLFQPNIRLGEIGRALAEGRDSDVFNPAAAPFGAPLPGTILPRRLGSPLGGLTEGDPAQAQHNLAVGQALLDQLGLSLSNVADATAQTPKQLADTASSLHLVAAAGAGIVALGNAIASNANAGGIFGALLSSAGAIASVLPGGQLAGALLGIGGGIISGLSRSDPVPVNVVDMSDRAAGKLGLTRITVVNRWASMPSRQDLANAQYEQGRRTRLRGELPLPVGA